MKPIRINNNITFRIGMTRLQQPETFPGAQLTLLLHHPLQTRKLDFIRDGNMLTAVWPGGEQELCGWYDVILAIDYGNKSMNHADKINAVRLVPHSCEEDDVLNGSQTIDIDLDVSVPGNGLSAYEIAVLHGYKGTEEQWIADLLPHESVSDLIVKTTWKELKELRDTGNLIPGMQYRITDYECTTTQEDTRSAGNQFDIIVTADSESVLNENARACRHESEDAEEECEELHLWVSEDNDGDYGIITSKRIPESIDDIVGRYNDDNETYLTEQRLHNYTSIDSASESALDMFWEVDEDDNGVDRYIYAGPFLDGGTNYSAWALRYSLDNKWWAQCAMRECIYVDYGLWLERKPKKDKDGKFAWYNSNFDEGDHCLYTDSETPSVDDGCAILNEDGEFEDDYSTICDTREPTDEGKGVITWMRDERGNEAPYDIKNIEFKRYKVTRTNDTGASLRNWMIGEYVGLKNCWGYSVDENDYVWYKTFKGAHKCIIHSTEYHSLNNVVVKGEVLNTEFGSQCTDNTFCGGVSSSRFSGYIWNSTFSGNIEYSTFSGYIWNSTFSGYVSAISIPRNLNQCIIESCKNMEFEKGSGAGEFHNIHVHSGVQGSSEYNKINVKVPVGQRKYTIEVVMNSNGQVRTFCLADLFDSINE